jgi:hypothetical protein
MAWRFQGRAKTSARNPQAFAVCDRCGMWYNRSALSWQFDYRGPVLQNLRILVCRQCYDTPQAQLKPIITGPDPLPILDPRPEFFALVEGDYWVLVTDPISNTPIRTNQGNFIATTPQMIPDADAAGSV